MCTLVMPSCPCMQPWLHGMQRTRISSCATISHVTMWLQVIHGDIGESPLETLAVVAQDVFMPILTAPANQQGWPDVVAKEVTENLHKFVSNGEQPGSTACTAQCNQLVSAAAGAQ